MRLRYVERHHMRQSAYNLRYSRLLSLPLIGVSLYFLQLFLLRVGFLHTVWISRKAVPVRTRLLHLLQQKASVIFCQAWQLGEQLRPLQHNFVLVYRESHPRNLDLSDLYCLQWSLTLAQAVTPESISSLGELLPKNYPVWRTVALSVHQELSVQCDFIEQTVKELVRRKFVVVLVSHVKQPSHIKERYTDQAKVLLIETPPPSFFSHLPYRLQLSATNIWKIFITLRIKYILQLFRNPLLWCFDPDDIQSLELFPPQIPTLYDCVDFYTSLDEKLKKKIEKNQQKLLRRATFVCVNSRTLDKIHKKIRKDVRLVPQGFDRSSFLTVARKAKSEQVRAFFSALRERQKSYRGVVTYVGTLSYRVDYQLLIQVIRSTPKLLFCLPQTVLPWQAEDETTLWQQFLQELKALPNVLWFPQLKRVEVKMLLAQSNVGFIPYNTRFLFNRYCFPMKLFEHFSVGIPTVSTPIEELKYYADYVKVGRDSLQVRKHLLASVKKPLSSVQKKELEKLCQQHSWQAKVGTIVNLLNEEYYSKSQFLL